MNLNSNIMAINKRIWRQILDIIFQQKTGNFIELPYEITFNSNAKQRTKYESFLEEKQTKNNKIKGKFQKIPLYYRHIVKTPM